MGSGSSRPCERRPNSTKSKRRLSSFLCGCSTSPATAEAEDYPVDLRVDSAGCIRPVPDDSQAKHKDSILRSSEGIISDGGTLSNKGRVFKDAQSDIETASKENRYTEGNEPVLAHHLHGESRNSQLGSTSGTSCSGEQSSRDLLLPRQELRSVHLDRAGSEGFSDVQTGIVDSVSVVSRDVSESHIGSRSLADGSIQAARPSDLGFLVSERIQGSSTESYVLHVDVLSISSVNFSGRSSEIFREARRNSRRIFWDAFSSHNSGRHTYSPNSHFGTDDAENIGSSQSWLLDFGSNIFDDGTSDDLWHLGGRGHLASERRLHSRFELWERLRGGTGERGGRVVCPSGLHPDGSCLCGLEDVASSQSSVSRVAMLAEALFEVLDELHRQQTSLGLSAFSKLAPESAVDSLPVKCIEKSTAVENGDDVEQCYICLEEYETGDNIRVLPCSHEYHMACVDKWLKEIHGVCPLCRGNITQGTTNSSLPDSDGSSMPVHVL